MPQANKISVQDAMKIQNLKSTKKAKTTLLTRQINMKLGTETQQRSTLQLEE